MLVRDKFQMPDLNYMPFSKTASMQAYGVCPRLVHRMKIYWEATHDLH